MYRQGFSPLQREEHANNPAPQPGALHLLFEQQVERTPDAVALANAPSQITYQHLNHLANHLAHRLRREQVGIEVRVGVACGQTPALLISLLAILKAGGVYLPLDPDYPAARLRWMQQDAGIGLLLTEHAAEDAVASEEIPVLALETLWESLAQESVDNLGLPVMEEQAAYVIYTSGSTGTPKGVLVSHRGLANVCAEQMRTFGVQAGDRVLWCASPGFDASIFEIVMALLSGATLCLGRTGTMLAGPLLAEELREQGISLVTLTPSVLATVAEQELSSLRAIIVAGEACSETLVKRWGRGRAFWNAYGPTETTIWASVARCEGEVGERVSIGRPISNMQIYLLDERREPVGYREVGEVYIGGVGLSRGYVGRAELTAERFVPHPFSEGAGERLYRTGDWGRWREDGMLEYVGREDRQVKVHGVRMELGEIEQVLIRHPAVQHAVVLVREHGSNNKQLIAYIVPHGSQKPDSHALREFLHASLPEHMLPAAFVFVKTLPLTPNGKLDYQALPSPEAARLDLDKEVITPQNEIESILAEIWEEVLDIQPIGIHDGFFDLGGDSMLSIRVLSLAEERGLAISLAQIFQNTTIHKLAQEMIMRKPAVAQTMATQKRTFRLLCEEDYQRLPGELEDAYPLTLLQTGMLFHSDYTPAAAMYHDISYIHVQAPYNILKLHNAIKQLALRHPVLRTSFDLSNFTEPLQLVHKNVVVPVQVDDLRHLSPTEQQRLLEDWTTAEKGRRFDWTQMPLWRIQVHRLNEETFRLTITKHHSILDGWSLASFFTELLQRYMSLVEKNTPLDASPLLSQFGEFVALERESLACEAMRQYWTQKLAEASSVRLPRWTSLSQVAVVPDVRDLPVPLSLKLSDDLRNIARRLDVPIKSVLLAAHLRVLSLLGGQTDILTGLVSNGRLETTDGEQVLGLFLNTLPYRQKLTGGTWSDLIRVTFENEQEILPFRRYPLARIQQEQGGTSLFEILFNFVHFHVYRELQKWQGLRFLGENDIGQTNFTFSAEFSQDVLTSQVNLNLFYDPTQLGDEQIQAISAYYVNALTALATEPEANYATAPLLADHEKQQLVYSWNATRSDFAPTQSICDTFEACVERTPDAVAVCMEDMQITYQTMDHRSNQCARHLQRLGVGTEVMVGLCVDASLEMLIGLWGILKAGGTYVPLDPATPGPRLLSIQQDASVAVIVTQERLLQLHFETSVPLVCLDRDWPEIALLDTTRPVRSGNAQNAAYVLYTSGSTGQPKGVVVEHRQLFNYTSSMMQKLESVPISHFALLHPLSVDFGLTTLFAALCRSGRLCLLPREQVTDPKMLEDFVQSGGIDCLKITPSHLSVFQTAHPTGHFMPRRLLILGGESFHDTLIQTLRSTANGCAILNHYGPTETTVGVLTYLVPDERDSQSSATVPLGSPLANTQVYLLDPYLEPVPVGVPGELYIGGANVARGYLGQPSLTAECFIPDPFSGDPGVRLYRTGDLARFLPGGAIEFLGRRDDQVKVRGYRIELGEVANALLHHDAIQDAVVLAHAEDPLNKRLIAYVVAQGAGAPTVEELYAYLQTQIPEYMLPAAFMFIDKLPLLPHGKVDRQKLAALALPQRRGKSFVAPCTATEIKLAEIWADLLKVDPVGIDDTFFELGGHSLLAMRIISRIRNAFQVDLPMRRLFEAQTIAHLAQAIEQAQSGESEREALLQALAAVEHITEEEARHMMSKRNLNMQ